ncbi:kinase-like protein [Dendrothele bispora CBS 962.96]|uniref:Kinase-like protein n=1 Tax=Dendrothele bispora (strain CBS 962.96) TaxID=1314807 RepID=A0A4V4HCP8_DENBC|nr:kinase-like protein [Dendrothele bispora CBS 962.96]
MRSTSSELRAEIQNGDHWEFDTVDLRTHIRNNDGALEILGVTMDRPLGVFNPRTCRNPRLVGDFLIIECKREDGEFKDSPLNLVTVLGITNGKFKWGGREFSSHARGICLSGSELSAQLKNGDRWEFDTVDLSTHIRNNNGVLEIFGVTMESSDDDPPPVYPRPPKTSQTSSTTTRTSRFSSPSESRSSYYFKKTVSADKISLQGSVLHAHCRKADGSFASSKIDLDEYIGVVSGKLVWGCKGFRSKCTHIKLEEYIIKVECCDEETHSSVTADLDLTRYLQVYDGILAQQQTQHTTEISIVSTRLDDILTNRARFKNLSAQRGEVAQNLLDRLQALSDYPGMCEKQRLRSKIFEAMVHISRNSNLYPTCLSLSNVKKVGDDPIAGGGFGDIWRASIGGQTACMKVVRLFDDSKIDMFLKDFLKEAILWRQLQHPNVLPFLGLYFLDDTRKRICLLSPMMENGNLNSYLGKHSEEDTHRVTLAYDVSCGLSYLHKMKIVHGDLKGVNVFITAARRAVIADFGLSHVADSELHKWASLSTSSHSDKGTTRWLAPECLKGGPINYASDVYAFACVCYEIFTGLLPFHELKDVAVMFKVIQGQRPDRPDNIVHRYLSDSMWAIIQQCWSQEPKDRPEANVLPSRVMLANGKVIEPADNWDMSLPTELWSSLRHPKLYPTGPDLEELLSRLETDTTLEPISKSVE